MRLHSDIRQSEPKNRPTTSVRGRCWCLGPRATAFTLLGCIVGLAWFAETVGAQGQVIDREYKIKAAYLYNFGRYTEWLPAKKDGPTFAIGVVGNTPLSNEIKRIAKKKKLHNKRITVRQVTKVGDLKACQIVFFADDPTLPVNAQNERLDDVLLKHAKSLPILTVGEKPGFCQSGGVMCFYLANNKTKFEINPDAATRANLKLSAKLLQLGKIVQKRPVPVRVGP